MDKKELKKLLEEKKLADTLMKDESFRKGAEEILKSEGVDYKSGDLESMLKAIEKVLSGEVKVENDDDLDEVVGGISAKGVARGTIKAVCVVGGGILGGKVKRKIVGKAFSYAGIRTSEDYGKFAINNPKTAAAIGVGNCVVGLSAEIGGGYAGYKLGNYICEKLGLND